MNYLYHQCWYLVFQVVDHPNVAAPGHGDLVWLEAVGEVLLLQAGAGQGDEGGGAGPHPGGDRYSLLRFCHIEHRFILKIESRKVR